jgi:N-acetylglucosamine-6-phosphate deacetylase
MVEGAVEGVKGSVDIINAQVPGVQGWQRIRLRHGVVAAIGPMAEEWPEPGAETWDLGGDWVSLGGVDLQINGGLGLAFPDLVMTDQDKLQQICDYLWEQGVDGFLPTLVTTSIENIQRAIAVLQSFSSHSGAKILGVHLEGPFLNVQKRGAHPAEYLLPLTLPHVQQVLGDSDLVKIMTLAPELDATGEVIPYLKSRGIVVSLGHSQATAAQATQAFQQGATMITHAFNAMPPLHHREPGLLGAALTQAQVACGFIADGEHIVPSMLKILLRSGQNLFLVSDALSPLGLPDGDYPWDSRQITVTNGTARLPDGTLSGTTRSLLTGVQNLVNWGIADVETAIALATVAPRKAIGLSVDLIGQPLLRWRLADHLTWQRL